MVTVAAGFPGIHESVRRGGTRSDPAILSGIGPVSGAERERQCTAIGVKSSHLFYIACRLTALCLGFCQPAMSSAIGNPSDRAEHVGVCSDFILVVPVAAGFPGIHESVRRGWQPGG